MGASQAVRGKEPACQLMQERLKEVGSIPGSGRSPGGGNGDPLQYSCLENPTDGDAWRATVQGVTKSQTGLSYQAHTHTDPSTIHGMATIPKTAS